ncbi:ADP-ribose pyrophosphatase [Clostridium cavendishii DSM 21758]|uniref:ADP-ribose pyrophosphatase n=1 Tax=Clostridium cavendishii DSM 21758 TaxID=1121302 RepID=A0A1M6KIH2_9CLOT|nr:NUDIX hydrolase [Clostridium cavendishii]SHJ58757.1 ADP-ribose pyrophosphatase [Clostridium cavendishii DSM 21758]
MKLEEELLEEKLIHKGSFLTVVNQKVKLPNGKIGFRDIIKHPGAVAIVAFSEENKIILIEQFRKALDEIILEIPAGKLDNTEEPIKAAIRELKEETGYIADKVEYLGKFVTAPGFCDEIIYIFKATNLTKGKTSLDEDEFINVKAYSINEIKAMIKKGYIKDAKTIAAFGYL